MRTAAETGRRRSKSPRKVFAPAALRSRRDLADLQRAMWKLISRPLNRNNRMPREWTDGRSTQAVAAEIARPNDRLTSLERLEIYSRMYWFRVLDSLYDDLPGLRAALGVRRFMRLIEAYLVRYPSRTFTMRNLPDRLVRFILENPRLTRPHTELCADIARLEWARIEVFDTASLSLFTADDLLDADPSNLRLNLQPYVQLLELGYPVDDFLLAAKQREELSRGDASNTALASPSARRKSRRVRLPRPARTCLAVHRIDGMIYYKRLEPAALKVLRAIRGGKTLNRALSAAIPPARKPRVDWPEKVQRWFRNWMELGWFCRR